MSRAEQRQPDAIAPDGSEIRVLGHAAKRPSLVEVTPAVGQASPPVRNKNVEEIWYVTSGDGEIWRRPPADQPGESEVIRAAMGDAVVIPTGWAFQFRASPREPLRFICFTSPPWPGEEEAVAAEPGAWEPSV